MTLRTVIVGIWLLLGLCSEGNADTSLPSGVRVVFAPDGDVEQALVDAINSASIEILVSQNVITNPKIADALVAAFRERRVIAAVILDSAPPIANYTTPLYLAQRGLPVVLLDRPNNSRYMIIDRTILVTGSADWTKSVNRNHENLLIVQEPTIALAYRRQFQRDLERGHMVDPSQGSKAELK